VLGRGTDTPSVAGRVESIGVPCDRSLDRLARIAARALRAPAALVSLDGGDGTFLIGAAGLSAKHRGRVARAARVVAGAGAVSVADVRRDRRFAAGPLLAEVGVLAFAGAPLRTSARAALGSFCVLDTRPRDWTADELTTLEDLAAAAVCELDAREDGRALCETTQHYRALVEQAPVCTYRQVASGDELLYLGSQIEALTGYRPEEWSDALFGERLHPDDRDRVLSEVSRCRSEGREFWMEYRFIARDGRTAWLLDKTVPIRDDAGGIAFRQGFLLDITPAKEAEAALRLREEQLRQTQKLEAIGNLAGGVAHDFNNILLVIRGYCSLLLTQLAGTPEAEQLIEMDAAAERGADLVRQLLAYGRRQRLEPVRANLNDLVAETVTFLERLIGDDVELRTSLDADIPSVRVDPVRLEEAIVNLAANARDAMPAGGTLEIATETVELPREEDDPGLPHGRYVALSVTDTGLGMDDVTARRIFDPFFTSKPDGEGTGLGLAMVHGFVAQSAGAIDVQTAAGRGTTFTLYFPVVAGAPEQRDAPPISEPGAGGSERILLVEDRGDVRQVIGEMLRRSGYEVVAVSRPVEALEVVAEDAAAVDLVVTDVVMPEMSGIELAKLVRGVRPEVPVLLISGFASSSAAEIHLMSRHHLLQKPFDSTELGSAVRAALEPAA
jgi:two-component system, cell cycle sensor histidine kinase and response regulator CckA